MTPTRHEVADYLASLTDDEYTTLATEARGTNEARAFVRNLFHKDEETQQ
ncbi:hypothetical protein C8E05_3814 [Rhodococcus wratislaviensis]|uniref:Uncharacterized protein n=1 Tax=Rhodococcus wratislaviensis TaxID=44752 RepID=A0AB38FKS4_RHOWR|nr:hypothetical protein [Rhodococcus wratislaviensis]REE74379.1 hypothetical protein C8E05_3814 [Rhodococcus wratislaviensis]SPZ42084.1 Uncharacterised protein [Rhodococcus wratislaviensis]